MHTLSRRSLLTWRSPTEETPRQDLPRQDRSIQPTFAADAEIVHLLNRITWGPRPEEVAHAQAIGYDAFLEEQLSPTSLDDAAADAAVAKVAILGLSRAELYRMHDNEGRCRKALIDGFLARTVHSRRQLFERVVEFWADHFNISADAYTPDLVIFQREAIRKHAFGRFRDLLFATAKSPAMLYYLDNFVNVAAHPNENYARELLELHTLGVDGGYTETDVKEVARAFTGWTVHPRTSDGFYFNSAEHDTDPKTVLGHSLPAGRGLEDGLHVLHILTHHPATARFICKKLCVRFVSDRPPADLIDRMAEMWQQTDGEIVSVLRVLFQSNEFKASAGQKLRRPLDFFVGALRATGTRVLRWWKLEEILSDLGQPPYGWSPPNGYPDVAGAWINTSGMLARWNVSMLLTHSAYSDAGNTGYALLANLRERIGSPQTAGALVDAVAAQVFGAPFTGAAHDQFVRYLGDDVTTDTPISSITIGKKLASLYGIMLASPYFQWR